MFFVFLLILSFLFIFFYYSLKESEKKILKNENIIKNKGISLLRTNLKNDKFIGLVRNDKKLLKKLVYFFIFIILMIIISLMLVIIALNHFPG